MPDTTPVSELPTSIRIIPGQLLTPEQRTLVFGGNPQGFLSALSVLASPPTPEKVEAAS